MRQSTLVAARLESVGRPEHTKTFVDIRIDELIREFARWMLAVHMGHKIRVTIARDQTELGDRRSAIQTDLMGELDSLLAKQEEESEDGHS